MDRIFEAYNGTMGTEFMHKTRERLHWICSQVWGSRVLDVGCSQGVVPIILARMGYAVDGLDINQEAIAFANEQLAKEPQDIQSKVTYAAVDFGKFVPTKDRTYDVITMSEVLEHLVRPQDFIRKAFSILPEKGRLIVTVPFGINDDPDHRQTFYLTSIYSLIHPFFEIGGVKIFGGWIGLSCRRRAAETKEPPVIPLNLMRQAEEAFFKIERPLRDGTLAVRNQRQALKAEQEKLAEDLRAAEKARLEAEARVAAADTTPLRSELADVRGQLSVSEGEKQSLQTSLEVERKASAGLQDQVSMLKAMLQFATSRPQDNSQETRLLEYSQEVRDLRSALDQKRDEAISRAEEFGRLAGRVEYLQSSNRQLAAECEALEKQVAQQESAAASAKDAAASEQAQREKISEEMSEAGKRLESQAARIEELEAELDRRRTWTEQHKRESKDVRMQLFSVQNELAEKKRALSDFESRLATESKAHQEALAKIDELGLQANEQSAQVAEQAMRIKALETELAEQEKKLQGNGAALAKSEEACISERKAKQEAVAKVADLVKQVEALKKESSGHLAELAKLRAENTTLTARCDSAEKARKEFSDQVNGSAQTIRRLNGDLAKTKAKLSKTEKRLDDLSKAKLCRLTLKYWKLKDAVKGKLRSKAKPADTHTDAQSVSVIIPTYKENPYLEEAVQSVLKQNYPTDKLVALVCVNGPDEKYYKSLRRKYAHEKRVQVLYTKVAGANAGRNVGVRAANGDLITFLDDDDILTKGYVRQMVEGFIAPDINMVFGASFNLDDQTGNIDVNTYINKSMQKLGAIVTDDYNSLSCHLSLFWGKLYKTAYFKSAFGKLREGEPHSEDVTFWADHFCDLQGRISLVDVAQGEGYVRRIVRDSLSRPEGNRKFAFYVTDRLSIVKELAEKLLNIARATEHKRFLINKIKAQTSIILKYVQSLPPEQKGKALDLIARENNPFLNKSLFSTRSAIAFCHNFSPTIDASAFVATKRLREIDQIEGSALNWNVISQDMSKIRTSDHEFQMFYAQFCFARQHVVKGSFGFAPKLQEPYVAQAIQMTQDMPEAEVIYSRALFVGSHMAAYRYKKEHPRAKWYAEFSDPIAYGTDNCPRACAQSPNWFDVEKMVYELADVILYTNHNQMEYMLRYNPLKSLEVSIRRRARVMHHPILQHEICNLMKVDYDLPSEMINIGYFGTFYANRKCDDMLTLLDNPNVMIHVFTTKPEELKSLVGKYKGRLVANPTISHLKFLNIGSRFDYLFLNDVDFTGDINPYLPSKYADYLTTRTPIIAKVEKGSVLDMETNDRLTKAYEITSQFAMSLKKRVYR